MLSEDLLIGADQAAKFTGLTRRTIYHLVEQNEIPYRRIGARLYFRKTLLDIRFGGASEMISPPKHHNENSGD